MLILHGVTYAHPNREPLFSDLNLTITKREKIAIVGNNGSGKSTLIRLIAGAFPLTSGQILLHGKVYHVPQVTTEYGGSVAQALGIADKLAALREILDGNLSESNMSVLDDDWSIEERCQEAFAYWGLPGIDLLSNMSELSGGQRTKVLLAGINIHKPDLVLLDEPSNHLDTEGRDILYRFIRFTNQSVIVISHDRTLLNMLEKTVELSNGVLKIYGGNYEFYRAQREIERLAFEQELRSSEKIFRKAKEKERESAERQEKLDARGKRKQEKSGLPTIAMNTFRNNAENSTARIKGMHEQKIEAISGEVKSLREQLADEDKMKMSFGESSMHKGKLLVNVSGMNFRYSAEAIWPSNLDFEIRGHDRIAIKGANGSGKTTLVQLIIGQQQAWKGKIDRVPFSHMFIDQNYSLLNDELTVFEQAQQFNPGDMQEHEVKSKLNRFLFTSETWTRKCADLSGGEKLRLTLCSLTLLQRAPDMLILDEPTNNLDLQNVEILTGAVNAYHGVLLVISHDEVFLSEVRVNKTITLA